MKNYLLLFAIVITLQVKSQENKFAPPWNNYIEYKEDTLFSISTLKNYTKLPQPSELIYTNSIFAKRLDLNSPDSILFYKYRNRVLTDSIVIAKKTCTFNSSGCIEDIYLQKEDGWFHKEILEHKYNIDHTNTFDSRKTYSETEMAWIWDYKQSYYLDDSTMVWTKLNWDTTNSIWRGYKHNWTFANDHMILSEDSIWDSVNNFWVGNYKSVWAYDDNDNMTLYEVYDYRDNHYHLTEKEEHKFTNNNLTISLYYFCGPNDSYVDYKEVSSYNGNDLKLTKYFIFDKDQNQFVLDKKTEFTTNLFHNIVLEKTYNWGGDETGFIKTLKKEHSYDISNNLVLTKGYRWKSEDNSWVWESKRICTYDINNNRTLDEKLILEDNTWKTLWKFINAFDSNNNKTLSEGYYWDDVNNVLKGNSKYINSFDTNGNITLSEMYSWDNGNNNWVGTMKEVRKYDTNNNVTLFEGYNWDNENNNWIGYYKIIYSVSETGQYYYARQSKWDTNTNNWYIFGPHIYYFNGHQFLSNSIIDDNSYNVFPNPILTNNRLTIQSKRDKKFQYSFFNSNGMLIMDGHSNKKQKSIDVSVLPKGVYLIKISNSEGSFYKRFIK